MIDWRLAPLGANELVRNGFRIAFRDDAGNVYMSTGWEYIESWDLAEVIATRPTQTKTVADAVEVFDSKWPEHMAQGGCADVIVYIPSSKSWIVASEAWSGGGEWYEVCTRAEFESYVNASKIGKILESSDEKEGEKWTHTYTDDTGTDIRCRLLAEHGEWAWIEDAVTVDTISKSWLKPIKPTISTKEYDMLAKYAAALNVDPAQFEQYMIDNYDSKLKD